MLLVREKKIKKGPCWDSHYNSIDPQKQSLKYLPYIQHNKTPLYINYIQKKEKKKKIRKLGDAKDKKPHPHDPPIA